MSKKTGGALLGDRATLVQIPGAGHLMLITKPGITGAMMVSF